MHACWTRTAVSLVVACLERVCVSVGTLAGVLPSHHRVTEQVHKGQPIVAAAAARRRGPWCQGVARNHDRAQQEAAVGVLLVV